MFPKIIIHNSVSIDGSLTDFNINMELHYRIATGYKPDIHLIGSNTVKIGAELYGGVPKENSGDFVKQKRDKCFPIWAIIDTRGSLKGLLHTCRRFDFCRDVVVFISKATPKNYIKHLVERKYDFHTAGTKKVDLKKVISILADKYGAKTILTDTGRILGNLLLNQGMADEISLLIHPEICGAKRYDMFTDIKKNINAQLYKSEVFQKKYIWLRYKMCKNNKSGSK